MDFVLSALQRDSWGIAAIILVSIWALHSFHRSRKLQIPVPYVGKCGILGPWISALQWESKARELVQEGYEKHGNFAFKVALLNRWEVCICNEDMIREYKNLMDNQFSAIAVTSELFQIKWTAPGTEEGAHKISIPLLGKALTWQRNRSAAQNDPYFSEFVEEFLYAWKEEVPVPENGDYELPCFETGARVVAHLTARSLVGYPLCRNPEIVNLFTDYGSAVPTSGFFIAMFPEIMKPFVANFCSAPRISKRLQAILLEEFAKRREEGGIESTDIMGWLRNWTDQNEPGVYGDLEITSSIIATIFGAIHTTTQVLVHCLFELATRPEYVEPLRVEIQSALEEHGGWVKEGIEGMVKLDSFIKECQRFNPLDAGSLARRATKDFTFKNGLTIPEGTFVFAPNGPILFDDTLYPEARQFDGYRFYNLGQKTGKPQDFRFAATNQKYLQFGDGRHTCPGRWMASDEIRLMLAHILMNYDIATKDNKGRPENWIFKKILFPDMKAVVILKARKSVSA
uniref:Cytochrome P450 monooxygenase paxQ n=1 Tax=Penicillium paxilli TaxID=70109 RepID=PAXQ_PENPX|nr:RecName: Full=Cytochrome P450 monooxygenase paxQ; AltName: Full=Paxilline synthesis protein Q [Penicillium paxilli]AAK11527.1 PaxQ [Penicillium paxilli]